MRNLHSDLQLAVTAPDISWLYLIRLEFDEGTAAWTTGYNTVNHLGVDYIPAGHLASISPVKESGGFKSAGMSVGMSGIDPVIVQMMQATNSQDRPAFVYCCATDKSLVYSANKTRLYFAGRVDGIDGTMGQSPSFTVALRSRLSDWQRVRSIKYTDADQQRLHPGDRGMEYIPQLSKRVIVWPKAAFFPDVRI